MTTLENILQGQHWLVYCNNVRGLVEALGMEYNAVEWRLFLDSSVRSMKAVVLYIGNKVASVPVAHSVIFKDSYLDIKYLLDALATIFTSGRFVVI